MSRKIRLKAELAIRNVGSRYYEESYLIHFLNPEAMIRLTPADELPIFVECILDNLLDEGHGADAALLCGFIDEILIKLSGTSTIKDDDLITLVDIMLTLNGDVKDEHSRKLIHYLTAGGRVIIRAPKCLHKASSIFGRVIQGAIKQPKPKLSTDKNELRLYHESLVKSRFVSDGSFMTDMILTARP